MLKEHSKETNEKIYEHRHVTRAMRKRVEWLRVNLATVPQLPSQTRFLFSQFVAVPG